MKKVYKYLIFIFLFIVFLLFNLIVSPLNLDEIWSYGFSNNIFLGLIPYKDFNMVITPFYSFLMALPMKLFGNNLIVFHIENTIIITLFLIIVYKLIKEKIFIILPLLIFPMNITFPNYNFFILFLFILLIYLEKKKKNNILIGLIISLIFLTKQSVGIFLLPITLFYGKDKLKRFIGFIIPNIIFTIYLLITNSFKEFFDLCFLGLFDFGKGNSSFSIFFIFTILLLITLLFMIKKNKKIEYYYLLTFILICVPLFDLYHFFIYLLAYLIILIMNDNIFIFKPKLVGITLFIGILSIYTIKSNFNIKYYPNKLNKFEYRYIENKNIKSTNEVIKYMNKYNNKVMFIGPNAYYYKIITNQKINYLDLINTGNFGYNGSNKLLNKVKELDKDYVFFVKKNELGNGKQTDQDLIKYIIKNGKKIDHVYLYDIYRLGDIDD